MRKMLVFSLFVLFLSVKAFADDAPLLLPNSVIQNGCSIDYLGDYSDEILMVPVYEDTIYNCDAGYYLPQNSEVCTICPENFYCEGLTDVTYSESEDQGKEPCAEGLTSPEGTRNIAGCGKVMRIGDDSLYLTTEQQSTPALAVRIDDTVYYANMSPVSEGENNMNKDTTVSVRAMVDDTEYYIHDNTVQVE